MMENTGTVCTQMADPSPGAITMVEVNLKRTFSSGEGSGHQRQCYDCGKSGHLAKVCPSKYKVATKTDKKEERKIIQTANISYSTL